MAPYERAVKRIAKRDWPELRDAWMTHVARLPEDMGAAPEVELSDLPGMAERISDRTACHRFTDVVLGPALLQQACFLLQKAGNVIVASHDQVIGGLPTWSLATAYQGAFFAAEAASALMGVVVLSADSKRYSIIDIWPGPPPKLSQSKLKNYQHGRDVEVIALPDTASHFHRWAILQRLLNTTTGLPIDAALQSVLVDMSDKDFALQRNNLHYSHTWEFDDLRDYLQIEELKNFESKATVLDRLSTESPYFSIALASVVFHLAYEMVAEIAEISPQISIEYESLRAATSFSRMKLRENFNVAMAT